MKWDSKFVAGAVGGVVTIVASLVAFYIQFVESDRAKQNAELAMMRVDLAIRMESNIEELSKKIDSIGKQIDVSPEALVETAIARKLQQLDEKIELVDDNNIALRQAINPLKPDEVLKIARLTDELNSLKTDIAEYQQINIREMKNFQESILR